VKTVRRQCLRSARACATADDTDGEALPSERREITIASTNEQATVHTLNVWLIHNGSAMPSRRGGSPQERCDTRRGTGQSSRRCSETGCHEDPRRMRMRRGNCTRPRRTNCAECSEEHDGHTARIGRAARLAASLPRAHSRSTSPRRLDDAPVDFVKASAEPTAAIHAFASRAAGEKATPPVDRPRQQITNEFGTVETRKKRLMRDRNGEGSRDRADAAHARASTTSNAAATAARVKHRDSLTSKSSRSTPERPES